MVTIALLATVLAQDLTDFTTAREWTVGDKTFSAFYLGTENGKVRLRLDGETEVLKVPITDLSKADLTYIAERRHKLSPLPVLQPEVFTGKVKRVKDGDSLVVIVGKQEVEIRLHGIDAPEYDQPFGKQAGAALGRLVRGKTLRFEKLDTDRYGRSVCLVYKGKMSVNAKMVEIGAAWHFKRYSDDPKLAELEVEAREAKRGLWAEDGAVEPWEWRKR